MRQLDLAYKVLRQDIMTCKLQPGSEVTEIDLAVKYSYGRATIRAALMKLTQEKLVVALPRRGYQVAPITLKDVQEIFQLRAILEPAAVELATDHVDIDRLREIDAICSRGYNPSDEESKEAFVKANRDFHGLIIHACGNQRLVEMLEHIIDQMERLFLVGLQFSFRREELRRQHTLLVTAMVERNKADARTAAANHIESMRRTVIDSILQSRNLQGASVFQKERFGGALVASDDIIRLGGR